MPIDPYSVLGVERTASEQDIKKAYRAKAHLHHPDKKGGDEARFKEINEAYQILGNKAKREQYDRFGSTDTNGRASGFSGYESGAGGFESIFDMFSGSFGGTTAQRAQKGEDLHLSVHASKRDLGKRKVYEFEVFEACADCTASGVATGSKMVSCSQCGGQGRVRQTVRTPFGTFAQVMPCASCEGEGSTPEKLCQKCGGTGRTKKKRKLEVHLPKSIERHHLMAFPHGGNAGPRNSPAGDLTVDISTDA